MICFVNANINLVDQGSLNVLVERKWFFKWILFKADKLQDKLFVTNNNSLRLNQK